MLIRRLSITTLFLSALCVLPDAVFAQAKAGSGAPDFPPGVFTDGGRYSLKDFEGKAVVLFFYEQNCPKCRGTIPDRNAVVQKFKDKPVKFLAIAAEDSFMEATAYGRETKLAMPTFADTLGLMQKRYGQKISLQNIYQVRVIGPNGNIAGYSMEADALDGLLNGVKWKYKDGGYDAKLSKAVELLEWNQYEVGLKALRPWLKKKDTAESAQKLYNAVKDEAGSWEIEAVASADKDPVRAYDLYSRLASCFPEEEMGKKAKEALVGLKSNKDVTAELAARKMYDQMNIALTKARPGQNADVAAFCKNIAKKYKDTPTGIKAAALAEEIGG